MISKRATAAEPRPLVPTGGPAELGRSLEGHQLGHFLLEKFVGGGGMGAVFRATDTKLSRIVAVKVMARDRSDDDTLRRFQNEAQSAARLDHPNIARVHYVGEDEGLNYIVFEFIEGTNIRDLVAQQGPLPLEEAISYALQVAEALEHAFQRDVVHRDIKPSNVLVMAHGHVKLVDMGLARMHQVEASNADLTATGVTLGTFDYISPEQARDPRSADVRSDLYSLGCTLYYMLTGRPPFPDGTVLQKLLSHSGDAPPDVRVFRPELSEDVCQVVHRLLAKQPSQRFQTPSELIGALLLLADGLGLDRLARSGTIWIAPNTGGWSLLERQLPWAVPTLLFAALVMMLQWGRIPGGRQQAEPVRPSYSSAIAAASLRSPVTSTAEEHASAAADASSSREARPSPEQNAPAATPPVTTPPVTENPARGDSTSNESGIRLNGPESRDEDTDSVIPAGPRSPLDSPSNKNTPGDPSGAEFQRDERPSSGSDATGNPAGPSAGSGSSAGSSASPPAGNTAGDTAPGGIARNANAAAEAPRGAGVPGDFGPAIAPRTPGETTPAGPPAVVERTLPADGERETLAANGERATPSLAAKTATTRDPTADSGLDRRDAIASPLDAANVARGVSVGGGAGVGATENGTVGRGTGVPGDEAGVGPGRPTVPDVSEPLDSEVRRIIVGDTASLDTASLDTASLDTDSLETDSLETESAVESLPAGSSDKNASESASAPRVTIPSRRVDHLHEAFRAAVELPNVDTIELRYHGARVARPFDVSVPSRRITVRAGSGYQPVVLFRPSATEPLVERRMIRVLRSSLTWDSIPIEMELPSEPSDDWSLFYLDRPGRLEINQSSLTIRERDESRRVAQGVSFIRFAERIDTETMMDMKTPRETAPTAIYLQRCLVRGPGNLIRASTGTPFRLAWNQGLFASTGGLIETQGARGQPQPSEVMSVELTNVTLALGRPLCQVRVEPETRFPLEFVGKFQDCIFLESEASALDGVGLTIFEQQYGAGVDVARYRPYLSGSGNYYPDDTVLLRLGPIGNQASAQQYTLRNRQEARQEKWYDEQPSAGMVMWRQLPPLDRPVERQTKNDYQLDETPDNPASRAGFDPTQLPE